ncbi:pyridoxamine 5'-phosphate oxidase family protein [Streptomyces sp. NPDC102274]|uniref:pyridoxamine 5'-phosphate oxidase family protein n=1 Tax=Streptomyces sp. NPDC102274 TaxID=3366151 RepID=UPI0038085AFC
MADRTRRLLDEARYLNLATVSPGGSPGVATLRYPWPDAPLYFLFGSATSSQHSRDITSSPPDQRIALSQWRQYVGWRSRRKSGG